MTDDEVELLAQELAKVGGTSWYPGRQPYPILRVVTDRYRDQARAIISAYDRMRARELDPRPEQVVEKVVVPSEGCEMR